MKIALGFNTVKPQIENSFAAIFADAAEHFANLLASATPRVEDCIDLDHSYESESESKASLTRTSMSAKFGPLTVTTRLEGADMFSVVWNNKMNNSSIGVHKFGKGRYVVELGLASGAKIEALNFKAIEHATAFALLNSDVTGVQEDHALKARKHYLQFLISQEGRARDAVKFTKTAWQVNRLRGKDVKFSEGTLDHIGRLMFLLTSEKAIITTVDADTGRPVKHTVPFSNIWIQ